VSEGHLLPGIVDFLAEGAAAGRDVRDLIGSDVAAFCDDLLGAADTARVAPSPRRG
jgi:DNA-binding ferritin-like protein (Dps family)